MLILTLDSCCILYTSHWKFPFWDLTISFGWFHWTRCDQTLMRESYYLMLAFFKGPSWTQKSEPLATIRSLLSASSSDRVLGFVSQLISELLGQDHFSHAMLRALHSSVTWQKHWACHPSLVVEYIIVKKSKNEISDDTESDFQLTIISF